MSVKETTDQPSEVIFNVMTDDQAKHIDKTLDKRDEREDMKAIHNAPFERGQVWTDPNYPDLSFKIETFYDDGIIGVYIRGEGVQNFMGPIQFNAQGEVMGSQFKPFKLAKLKQGV